MASTSNLTQKGQSVKWGTSNNTTYGLIQSIDHGQGAITKEYKDHEGTTKTLVVFDRHDTISLTAICLASSTLPQIGDQITVVVDGSSYTLYVTAANVQYANEDAAKISISGRTYPGIGAAS